MNGEQDLYANTQVIKLTDKDFDFASSSPKLINAKFKKNDGYVMIFAQWCPHCHEKKDFWAYLAEQFNEKGKHSGEHFRIGVIDCEDPKAERVVSELNVSGIPRFMHVDDQGELSEYEGIDHSPETLMSEVCQVSSKKRICRSDLNKRVAKNYSH